MCTENTDDIPIRTLVKKSPNGWTASCLDFGLAVEAGTIEDVLDALELRMSQHVQLAREGVTELFVSVDPKALAEYQKAAARKLLHDGPGHVEHRPLLLEEDMVATTGF